MEISSFISSCISIGHLIENWFIHKNRHFKVPFDLSISETVLYEKSLAPFKYFMFKFILLCSMFINETQNCIFEIENRPLEPTSQFSIIIRSIAIYLNNIIRNDAFCWLLQQYHFSTLRCMSFSFIERSAKAYHKIQSNGKRRPHSSKLLIINSMNGTGCNQWEWIKYFICRLFNCTLSTNLLLCYACHWLYELWLY